MKRRLSRLLLATASALALVVVVADPVAAHVTVNPREVVGGGFAVLTFRVPNERDAARTNKVQVSFPTTNPFTSVRVKRVPGWSAKFVMARVDPPIQSGGEVITEVVRSITWKAQGRQNAVLPTEFIDFDVSVGRLPTSGQIAFPAIQHYDNGEVVEWVEPTVPGQPPPARPAPVLRLIPPPSAPVSDTTTDTNTVVQLAAGTNTAEGGGSDGSTVPLVVALALLVGTGLVGAVRLRRGRPVVPR